MSKPNILIIDDDTIFQITTKLRIEKLGLAEDIQIANDGEAALALLTEMEVQKNIPDIIFLDINMPVMDGWHFIEEYQKSSIDKRSKIYMISSSINPADVDRAKTIDSIDNYIIKPVSEKVLEELLS